MYFIVIFLPFLRIVFYSRADEVEGFRYFSIDRLFDNQKASPLLEYGK